MTEDKANTDGQTKNEETQTDKKPRQTKSTKNQTDNVKWSIFTEIETKTAAGMAAKKAGKKLNEWIDYALREAATAELTTKPEPPAKVEDLVEDLLTRYTERLRTEQADTIKTQNAAIQQQQEQLKQLTEAINQQPKSLKELVFGKSKKG
jgi:hypothetical protein